MSLDNKYIYTVKAIEAFSSFFDRIASYSENPDANKEKMRVLKELVYNNANDYNKLKVGVDELLYDSNVSTAPSSDIKSNKKSDFCLTPTAPAKSSKLEPENRALTPTRVFDEKYQTMKEPKTPVSSEKPNEEIKTNYFSLISIDEMLGRFTSRSFSQDDFLTLQKLAGNFNSARIISDKYEVVYYALCCCFFEKFLKKKSKEGVYAFKQLLEAKPDNSSPEYNLFYSLLAQISNQSNDDQLVINFYDNLTQNKNYLASLSFVFKEILNKYEPLKSRLNSFRWLNDLLESDKNAIQSFPNLLKCSIKIITIEHGMVLTKTYNPEPLPDARKNIREVVLVYHKTDNKVYLMNHNSSLASQKPAIQHSSSANYDSKTHTHHHSKALSKKNLSLDINAKINTIVQNNILQHDNSFSKAENHKQVDHFPVDKRIPTVNGGFNSYNPHTRSHTQLNSYNNFERKGSDTDRIMKTLPGDFYYALDSARNSVDHQERFKTAGDISENENRIKEYHLDTSNDKFKTLQYRSASRLYTTADNNKDISTSYFDKSKLNISGKYIDSSYTYTSGGYNTAIPSKTEVQTASNDHFLHFNPVLAKIMKNEFKAKQNS